MSMNVTFDPPGGGREFNSSAVNMENWAQHSSRLNGHGAPSPRARHLSARSLVPAANTPEEFAAEIRKDRALAQQVVKAAGLEPQ